MGQEEVGVSLSIRAILLEQFISNICDFVKHYQLCSSNLQI